MPPSNHQNAKQKFLDLLSLVFFSIFAIIFAWSLYMIIPGYLPHNPASLDGLVSFLGFIVMGISMIPLVLGLLTRSAYKKLTSEMQLPNVKADTSNDSMIITPERVNEIDVPKHVN